MDTTLRDQLAAHLRAFCNACQQNKPNEQANKPTIRVAYGTAGFRGHAQHIEHVLFKLGLVAPIRCLQLAARIGVMITASHNPVQDNGVKLIDPHGEMLQFEWEPIVEEFCNIFDQNQLLQRIESLIEQFQVNLSNAKGHIIIGHDTRPSSLTLVTLLKRGLDAWAPAITYTDYGLITTPALHYLVAESNRQSIQHDDQPPLSCYYDQLISATMDAFGAQTGSNCQHYSPEQLVVDCANGVGYETIKQLQANDKLKRVLPMKVINIGQDGGVLNHLCGADYVKTLQLPPSGANQVDKRYASLDGDADRVVYFYLVETDNDSQPLKLNLLDGDKIMALFTLYLKEALIKSELDERLSLGCIQTAYANGASTDYITKELGLKVDCVDTGVKNLHKKALDYDLSVYFEANGHGTIWVSPKAKSLIENNVSAKVADLGRLIAIINSYTGDAISDILLVETILRQYDWDVNKWYHLYLDRPSSLIKVEIKDRNCIKTTNAGRTCTEPVTLQPKIDAIVEEFGDGSRCFVRASGTENVVRIYAEANDQSKANRLAEKVGDLVKQLCN